MRGHKSGLLTAADYNNLCQCESLDDIKLNLVCGRRAHLLHCHVSAVNRPVHRTVGMPYNLTCATGKSLPCKGQPLRYVAQHDKVAASPWTQHCPGTWLAIEANGWRICCDGLWQGVLEQWLEVKQLNAMAQASPYRCCMQIICYMTTRPYPKIVVCLDMSGTTRQCVKCCLQTGTDYGPYLANEASPLFTATIVERCTEKLVDDWNKMRANVRCCVLQKTNDGLASIAFACQDGLH